MKNKNYKGTTLIEVFAVIGIIIIFSGFSWNIFLNNKRQAEVDAAASEIISVINETEILRL